MLFLYMYNRTQTEDPWLSEQQHKANEFLIKQELVYLCIAILVCSSFHAFSTWKFHYT